jgi:multicomponent Na+:H+ antiporter subunit B
VTVRTRTAVFLGAAAGAAAFLCWGLAGLPAFGHYRGPYGDVVETAAVAQRHVTNTVSAVVFDYRGFDTIGEEFILFASVIAVVMLLRSLRGEAPEQPAEEAERHARLPLSAASNLVVAASTVPLLTIGLYLVTSGILGPGGGFQGGVVLAAAPLAVLLASRYLSLAGASPLQALDTGEGVGAGGFVAVGLLGLLAGQAFLTNVLPHGVAGTFFAGGTIPVANVAVGVEVACGVTAIAYELLQQSLIARRRPDRGPHGPGAPRRR